MSVQLASAKTPETMRAWVLEAAGALDQIKNTFVKIPEPGPTEVRVKMACATVNPADYKRADLAGFAAFPAVLGVDGAGVIDAIGSAVKDAALQPGTRVHFFGNAFKAFGTFAEYSIVDSAAVVPIPSTLSFAEAGVSPCAAWTAYEALFERLQVEAGKTIYIASGAGGVGHYAVQMAFNAGLRIITTASGANVENLRASGRVALVVDYKSQNVKDAIMSFTNGEGVDYIFQMLGEAETAESLECLKFRGSICHIAGTVPSRPPGSFFHGITAHHVCIPMNLLHPETLKKFTHTGAAVAALLAKGAVKADISETIGFEGIGAALAAQQKGHVRGKVLISFSDPLERVHDIQYQP